MISGVVFLAGTGEVVRQITCPQGDLAGNLGAGEAFLETDRVGDHLWVRGGEVVVIPSPPSSYHDFDPAVWEWRDRRSSQQLADAAAAQARVERDALLQSCDWAMLPDSPTDKAAWQAYRQALRDISTQEGFPHRIEWPERPSQEV